jgi:rhomboid protease GluP
VLVGQSRSIPSKALTQVRNNIVVLIGLSLVYGFMAPGIDFAAHVGGLVSGFVIGLVLRQPLTVESLAWRPLRNLIALGVGAVLVGGGVLAVTVHHPGLIDEPAAFENFRQVEKKCVDTYNGALNKSREGRLTNAEFADVIDQDILPDWRAARERLSKVHDLPVDLKDYVRLRQEALEQMAQGYRKNDQGLVNQAEETNKRAEASLKRFNEKGGK